jgi:hypothetical protein
MPSMYNKKQIWDKIVTCCIQVLISITWGYMLAIVFVQSINLSTVLSENIRNDLTQLEAMAETSYL